MKNKYMRKKGMNPALIYMSESARVKTTLEASSAAVKMITLKILHDTFGFGEKRQQRFVNEFQRQMRAYEEGYFTIEDMQDLVENGLKDKRRHKSEDNT